MRKNRRRILRILMLSVLIILAAVSPVSAAKKTTKVKVSAPKNFRVESQGDLNATLRWTPQSGVSGFVLYLYDTKTKGYKEVKRLSGKSYTCKVSKLKNGTKYRYTLKAYKKKNGKYTFSSASKPVEFKARSLSDSVLSVRRPRYTVKTKKKVTVTNKTKNKKVTLAAGTKLTVTAKSGKTVTGYLKNGDQISIKRSYLKYTGLDSSSKKDYSKKVKEEFVNAKAYKSSTNWMIWVSESTFKVNIYKGSQGKWKLQESFPCCIGSWKTRTASGVRRILSKGTKWEYGGPWIYFSSGEGTPAEPEGCAFHHQVDSNMSKAVSHGCIRMTMTGLMYIYRNCPVGTRVVVY